MKVSRNAWLLFYLYVLAYFVIPTIVCYLYQESYAFLYKEVSYFSGLLVIPFLLAFFHIGDKFIPSLRLGFRNPFRHLLTNRFILIVASLGYLLLGIWFYKNYSLSFRHQMSLSEAGGKAFLLFGLRSWFKGYFLLMVFKHINQIRISKFDWLILFFATVSLILVPVSSFDVVTIAVSVLFLFGLQGTVFPLAKPKHILHKLASLLKPVLGVALIIGTVYSGTANKIGTDEANKLFSNKENIELLMLKTVKRASTWMVSIMAITKETENFYNPDMAAETIEGILINLKLRFCKLLGTECGAPSKYWAVTRRNFYYTYHARHWDPRTGSSPGIFATAFYVPYFPLGVLFVVVYSLFVLRRFSAALKKNAYLDWIGIFVLLFSVSPLFESPIDYLNFLSAAFIYALFFFAACSASREHLEKAKGDKLSVSK